MESESESKVNTNFNPSTCLAHVILIGSSAWCLTYTPRQCPWAYGTYTFLIAHGFLGCLNFGLPHETRIVIKTYEQTSLIAEIAPIPLFITEIYLLRGMQSEYAYIPAATAIIPLLSQFLIEEQNDKIIDVVLGVNLAVIVYFNINYDSPWTWGWIALAIHNQFLFRRVAERFGVPKMDIVALGISFTSVFAVNCLCDLAKLKS